MIYGESQEKSAFPPTLPHFMGNCNFLSGIGPHGAWLQILSADLESCIMRWKVEILSADCGMKIASIQNSSAYIWQK